MPSHGIIRLYRTMILGTLAFMITSIGYSMFVSSPSPGALSSSHEFLDKADKCTDCHSQELELKPGLCLLCHSSIQAQLDNKTGIHKGKKDHCETCHPEHRGKDVRPVEIDLSRFDHSDTGFALTGKHAQVEKCSSCHQSTDYSALTRTCTTCHLDPHKGKLGEQCQYCHQTESWQLPLTSHVSHAADFLLTGKHLVTPCEECHIKGDVKNTPRECEACHWVRKQDDPYRTRLGLECGRCHTPQGWSPANWEHSAETGFGLSGAHKSISCDRCHPNLQFQGIVSECFSCHAGDYNSANDPEHKRAGFPVECALCHRSTSWRDASFSHDGYELTGAHKSLSCGQCHTSGRYAGTPTDCFACHKADYEGAKAPDHRAGGFSVNCEQCHTTSRWADGAFDHNTTGFPLTGAHRTTSCSACHPNGRYQGTPTDCLSCHLADYERTAMPNHKNAGFSTTCSDCHSTSSWHDGGFDHNATGFVLEGAHKNLDCDRCHPNGRYQGTPTDCLSCHQSDYNNATNPNHKSAGFPTDCLICHGRTDMSWNQGFFDHPGFPIHSPPHSSFSCSDCHVNPSNFNQFVCTTCHYKTKMDSEHGSVPGYRFDDKFCYACHPDGKE